MTDNLCKNSDAIQNTKDVSKPRYVRKPRFVHHDKKTINGDTNNIKELESDSEYTDERRQDLEDRLDRIGIHPRIHRLNVKDFGKNSSTPMQLIHQNN